MVQAELVLHRSRETDQKSFEVFFLNRVFSLSQPCYVASLEETGKLGRLCPVSCIPVEELSLDVTGTSLKREVKDVRQIISAVFHLTY